jgi:hypothetical protein
MMPSGFGGFLGMLNDPMNRGKMLQMAGGLLGNSGQEEVGGMLGQVGGMMDMRNRMNRGGNNGAPQQLAPQVQPQAAQPQPMAMPQVPMMMGLDPAEAERERQRRQWGIY